MAVNESRKIWRPRRKKKKRNTAELSARLAPLEELTAKETGPAPAANGDGSIVIKSENINLPKGLIEEHREDRHWFRLEPVLLVILLIMLAFIIFIAWQIALMPEPVK